MVDENKNLDKEPFSAKPARPAGGASASAEATADKTEGEPEDIFADMSAEALPSRQAGPSGAKEEDEVAPPSPKSGVGPPTTAPSPTALEKKEPFAEKPTPPPKSAKQRKPVNIKRIVKLTVIVIVILVIGFAIFYGVSTFLSSKKTTGDTAPTAGTGTEPIPGSEPEPSPEVLDSDGDGLLDTKERELGTNRNSPDSDNDGLFDKEEVEVYTTDPLVSDTDEDGILDGDEVKQGTDPNDPTPGALLLDLQKEIERLRQ